MNMRVAIAAADLRTLGMAAMNAGTTHSFIQVVLDWADQANAEIERLRAANEELVASKRLLEERVAELQHRAFVPTDKEAADFERQMRKARDDLMNKIQATKVDEPRQILDPGELAKVKHPAGTFAPSATDPLGMYGPGNIQGEVATWKPTAVEVERNLDGCSVVTLPRTVYVGGNCGGRSVLIEGPNALGRWTITDGPMRSYIYAESETEALEKYRESHTEVVAPTLGAKPISGFNEPEPARVLNERGEAA